MEKKSKDQAVNVKAVNLQGRVPCTTAAPEEGTLHGLHQGLFKILLQLVHLFFYLLLYL